jgi:hypothetical protein
VIGSDDADAAPAAAPAAAVAAAGGVVALQATQFGSAVRGRIAWAATSARSEAGSTFGFSRLIVSWIDGKLVNPTGPWIGPRPGMAERLYAQPARARPSIPATTWRFIGILHPWRGDSKSIRPNPVDLPGRRRKRSPRIGNTNRTREVLDRADNCKTL